MATKKRKRKTKAVKKRSARARRPAQKKTTRTQTVQVVRVNARKSKGGARRRRRKSVRSNAGRYAPLLTLGELRSVLGSFPRSKQHAIRSTVRRHGKRYAVGRWGGSHAHAMKAADMLQARLAYLAGRRRRALRSRQISVVRI